MAGSPSTCLPCRHPFPAAQGLGKVFTPRSSALGHVACMSFFLSVFLCTPFPLRSFPLKSAQPRYDNRTLFRQLLSNFFFLHPIQFFCMTLPTLVNFFAKPQTIFFFPGFSSPPLSDSWRSLFSFPFLNACQAFTRRSNKYLTAPPVRNGFYFESLTFVTRPEFFLLLSA